MMMNNKLEFKNDNTIVNLANSILKHFNAPTHHTTIKEIDDALKGHKKVVVMLFDGLGTSLRKYNLDDKSAINTHFLHRINATYPPTTVASTSGFLSGLFPIENGWMSWRQYYDEYNCNILVFSGKDPDSKKWYKTSSGSSIHYQKFPFDNLAVQINKANNKHISDIMFPKILDKKGPKSLLGYKHKVTKYLKDKDECFLYVYNTQPDFYIHQYGVKHPKVKKLINRIDHMVDKLTKKNPDTLFLIIADHGLMDVTTVHVFEHKDFVDTFIHQPSFEGRTTTFFIKEDRKKEFEQLFDKYYGEHFMLLTKDEVLESNMFGEGKINKNALKYIGDYVSLSKDSYFFDLNKVQTKDDIFVAHHAGYTKEEMEIDVSVFNS